MWTSSVCHAQELELHIRSKQYVSREEIQSDLHFELAL